MCNVPSRGALRANGMSTHWTFLWPSYLLGSEGNERVSFFLTLFEIVVGSRAVYWSAGWYGETVNVIHLRRAVSTKWGARTTFFPSKSGTVSHARRLHPLIDTSLFDQLLQVLRTCLFLQQNDNASVIPGREWNFSIFLSVPKILTVYVTTVAIMKENSVTNKGSGQVKWVVHARFCEAFSWEYTSWKRKKQSKIYQNYWSKGEKQFLIHEDI